MQKTVFGQASGHRPRAASIFSERPRNRADQGKNKKKKIKGARAGKNSRSSVVKKGVAKCSNWEKKTRHPLRFLVQKHGGSLGGRGWKSEAVALRWMVVGWMLKAGRGWGMHAPFLNRFL